MESTTLEQAAESLLAPSPKRARKGGYRPRFDPLVCPHPYARPMSHPSLTRMGPVVVTNLVSRAVFVCARVRACVSTSGVCVRGRPCECLCVPQNPPPPPLSHFFSSWTRARPTPRNY